jgi:gas vesicle protein
MENKKMVKQMIDLHKTSFNNCFSTMVMLQDQVEKLLKTFVDSTPGIGSEGKKVIDQWTDAYKKGMDDLRKAIEEGYDKVEKFFDSDSLNVFHDHAGKMFDAFLNQKNWMPQEFRKTSEEFVASYQKSFDDFKKHFDENVKRMKNFLPAVDKTQAGDKQKK